MKADSAELFSGNCSKLFSQEPGGIKGIFLLNHPQLLRVLHNILPEAVSSPQTLLLVEIWLLMVGLGDLKDLFQTKQFHSVTLFSTRIWYL